MKKNHLAKKSVWIFGGDGWAYDIGYGGLDHVIASGEDVNIFVFDTEVYSIPADRHQASQLGQVAQSLQLVRISARKILILMTYGYVNGSDCYGSKPESDFESSPEVEAYPGPSIIIAYSPCEMHGIKGMATHRFA